MDKITFTAIGTTPISFSAPYREEKLAKESAQQYDDRCWRQHAHCEDDGTPNANGPAYIPGMALKQAVADATSRRREKIKGRGQSTYGPIVLSSFLPARGGFRLLGADGKPITRQSFACENVYCNADGKRGSGTRVWRKFPVTPAGWSADCEFILNADELVSAWEAVFGFVVLAGTGIGIGRWRAQKGGLFGQFRIEDCVATIDGKAHKWKP